MISVIGREIYVVRLPCHILCNVVSMLFSCFLICRSEDQYLIQKLHFLTLDANDLYFAPSKMVERFSSVQAFLQSKRSEQLMCGCCSTLSVSQKLLKPLKSFSPVCIFKCFLKSPILDDRLHLYGFPPVCIFK